MLFTRIGSIAPSLHMYKQEITMDIAIQPPSKHQAGQRLYPPVVVSLPPKNVVQDGTAEIFQGFLQHDNGDVVEDSGPYIAVPQPIYSSASNTTGCCSTDCQYVVFPDIVVGAPGRYTFTVRCYDPTNRSQSWTVLGSVQSRTITVAECRVQGDNRSETEERLLEDLKASGNFGL